MFHELRSYIMRWDGVTELSIKLRRQDGGILSVIKTWVKLRKSAKIVCQGLFADWFASRSSLASCHAAYWVQAVRDCSPLPARRSTTLSGRPHHAVCRSDRQSRPQIRHFWLRRSATYHVINGDHSFAVAAPRAWNELPSPLRRVDSANIFKR